MQQGFTITRAGHILLAKMLAGHTLKLSRVMVGSGKFDETVNPADLTNLIQPVAQATSTLPTTDKDTTTFTVEYRSDLNGGLDTGFWLNEFGIYAIDPDDGEILFYYATLGDYPQYVSKAGSGTVDIRRFPITIAITDGAKVEFIYEALGFMTAEEINYYITHTVVSAFTEQIDARIAIHNVHPNAHMDIRNLWEDLLARVKLLEDMYLTNIKDNAWKVKFDTLSGLIIEGVWNQAAQRIEF